jgi:hypothetical protein
VEVQQLSLEEVARDIVILTIGAAIAYVSGELRARGERRHSAKLAAEEREYRQSEATAERVRELQRAIVADARRMLLPYLAPKSWPASALAILG